MLKLKDIMSSHIVTVSPRTPLRNAAELLRRHRVSGMPVLTDDGLVGMISASDILAYAVPRWHAASAAESAAARTGWSESFLSDTEAPPAAPQDEAALLLALVGEPAGSSSAPAPSALDGHCVEEAMTRKVWGLDADADVSMAAQIMARNHIHRVIVVANGAPVGVVTASDITRALAEGRT